MATSEIKQVILRPGDSHSLYAQSMAAARALADGKPDDSVFRIYEIGDRVIAVMYRKASISVWPQEVV